MDQNPKSIAFVGSIPENYDGGMGDMFFEPYAKEMAGRVVALQPATLLEIACGTGRLTKYLSQQLPNTPITATDLNPPMLYFAKEKFPEVTNVHWEVADALALPYTDSSFDCVVVQFGVMFYSDKLQGFKESLRVLKKGGKFIFATWKSLEENTIAVLGNDAVKPFFPDNPPVFFNIPFSYYDKAQIRIEMTAAGFSNIQIDDVHLDGYNTTAENASRGLLEGSPLINFITERRPEKLPAIKERLAGEITKVYGKQDLIIPLGALIVSGEREGEKLKVES
jgi:ubiquinone/menaquinone biosynthesis C-methylase UbiE